MERVYVNECVYCGKQFKACYTDTLYCGSSCRSLAYLARIKNKSEGYKNTVKKSDFPKELFLTATYKLLKELTTEHDTKDFLKDMDIDSTSEIDQFNVKKLSARKFLIEEK